MRPGAVFSLVVLILVARAGTALAGDAEDAESLIREGLLLRREAKDAEALEVFRRAYRAHATPRGRAQIALAEQALGRWVDAESDLDIALRARDDPWIDANRTLLESGLAAIRSHLGWLVVESDVPGAELWINDARYGVSPLGRPLRMEAGSAVVEARGTGYAPVRRLAVVEAGGTARVSLHMVRLEERPAPEVPPRMAAAQGPERATAPNRALRNAGYTVLLSSVVDVAAGVYFGVRTFDAKGERDSQCPSTPGCDPLGVALDRQARSFAVASTAWFVAGGVALATGLGLVWVARSRTSRNGAREIRVAPAVGVDHAGAMVGGSF